MVAVVAAVFAVAVFVVTACAEECFAGLRKGSLLCAPVAAPAAFWPFAPQLSSLLLLFGSVLFCIVHKSAR